MNWLHPFLFAPIQAVVDRVGFIAGPAAIVRHVKAHDLTGTYDTLRDDVLRKWIETDKETGEKRWKPRVLLAVEKGGHGGGGNMTVVVSMVPGFSRKGSGLSNLFQKRYPDVFDGAITQIRVIRAAKNLVSGALARSIILAHVRHADLPGLASFKCSMRWLHRFFDNHLGWSYRSTTRAAQKLPDNWEEQCAETHARIAYALKLYDIPHGDFIVNADQTGVMLLPTGKKTWDERGAKQVPGISHDEKRQVRVDRLVQLNVKSLLNIYIRQHSSWRALAAAPCFHSNRCGQDPPISPYPPTMPKRKMLRSGMGSSGFMGTCVTGALRKLQKRLAHLYPARGQLTDQ